MFNIIKFQEVEESSAYHPTLMEEAYRCTDVLGVHEKYTRRKIIQVIKKTRESFINTHWIKAVNFMKDETEQEYAKIEFHNKTESYVLPNAFLNKYR